jgi:flagellar protein FlaG
MSDPITIAPATPPLPPVSAPSKGASKAEPAPEEKEERKSSAIETIAEAAKDLQSGTSGHSRLSIDHDAFVQAFIYRSVDKQTGEVIQQWPGEDALRLRRYLRELAGLVVDELA